MATDSPSYHPIIYVRGYAGTQSEQLLGEFLESRRDEIILTSKCGFPVGSAERNNRGLSRRHKRAYRAGRSRRHAAVS